MKRLFAIAAAVLSIAALVRADTELPRLRLAIGPVWTPGTKLSASWHPDTVRAMFPIAWGTSTSGGGAPPATGYANRNYADGHVRLDAGTTDPETMEYGLTWNWGYDHASQYDGSTVAFHTRPSTTTTLRPLDAPDAYDHDDLGFLGTDFTVELALCTVFGADAGLSLGFRWFDDNDADFQRSASIARETRSSSRITDQYDAHWSGFPSAPYSGAPDGPGYLLDNVPRSRSVESLGRSSATWMAQSRARVEVERLELRLGIPVEWRLADHLALGLRPHVACARLDLSTDVETSVTVGQTVKYRDTRHTDKDAWLWGAGVAATLAVPIGRGWSVAAIASYDAWFDDLTVTAGPFDFKAELGAWAFCVAIEKEF